MKGKDIGEGKGPGSRERKESRGRKITCGEEGYQERGVVKGRRGGRCICSQVRRNLVLVIIIIKSFIRTLEFSSEVTAVFHCAPFDNEICFRIRSRLITCVIMLSFIIAPIKR